MAYIKSLHLNHFRNYGAAGLAELSAGPVVLCGPNGAGKTNILEAVSFLSPGRGLRGARVGEVQQRTDMSRQWSVSVILESRYGPVRIGTGQGEEDRRIIRINGESAKGGQAAMTEYLSVIWLTPQMDRLFADASSARRKFLDRMVFAFDPGHSGRIARYENAMRQRSRLLQDGSADPSWLAALEATMAETGVAIAAARQDFVRKLQQGVDRTPADIQAHFPKASIATRGTVEELVRRTPALEVEEMLRYQLQESRLHDSRTGGAATGPHKSDLHVVYEGKSMPADQCSTGEQKALLIGIVLAHARMVAAEHGAPPVLLLDEVAAHLDHQRRSVLYRILLDLGVQVWMTGTDQALFESLTGQGAFFTVQGGQIAPSTQGRAA
ncbi:MAG TPA: DNA replication/repair protein RecF [Micavibrio sp.]|jgi:DNA replication and repair protein RecF